MKKCPTCDKTFDDSMKFCQVDGTPLVADEPAFDPYATMVGKPVPPPADEPAPTYEPQPEEPAPIAPPDNVLEMPEADPLKTMYVSEAELKEAMGQGAEEPIVEIPPAPEPPSFSSPEPPPPSFGDMASPPPSPFSTPAPQPEEPLPSAPRFDEAPTVVSTPPFEAASSQPPAEWTPPPAPDAAWQNQEIGSNTPFQSPAAGVQGESKGLALASLICGILSCLCCISVLTGPAAVIMGFLAKKNADENPQQYGGRGMAVAGMITGAVGFLLGVVLIIMQIFFGILGSLGR